MKSVERSIYIVIIIILVACLASGTTYMIMKDKNDNKINDNESNNQDAENNDTEKIEDKEEQITLSESELETYLNYVPYRGNILKNDNNINPYLQNLKVTDLNDINLTEYAIRLANFEDLDYIFEEDYLIKISANEVKSILKSVYNKSIEYFKTGKDNNNQEYYNINCLSLLYENNFFYGRFGCGDAETKVGVVDNYKLENNNLIIYEYAGLLDDLIGKIYNIKNNQTITNIEIGYQEDLAETIAKATKYIKENKIKFTKYKHTFKKNNTGYYWYSTEYIEG